MSVIVFELRLELGGTPELQEILDAPETESSSIVVAPELL